MQADRRDVRIALQQLGDVIGEWVQHAGPSRALHFHRFCSLLFVTRQHAGHTFAGDSQQFGDAPLRSTSVAQSDDLVCRLLLEKKKLGSALPDHPGKARALLCVISTLLSLYPLSPTVSRLVPT